jgi:murein DD-endopeptidase MepM/ murein hydrolase activator NlpD
MSIYYRMSGSVMKSGLFKVSRLECPVSIRSFVHSIENFSRNNGKSILRLAMFLCVFWLWDSVTGFLPACGALPAGMTLVPNGVGGGSPPQKVVSGKEDGAFSEEPGALETGVPEPESFSRPRPLLYRAYTIQKGDIIGDLAAGFGLNQDTLISANGIKNTRLIQIGQVLRVPNQDGIFYTVKSGDTLGKIAEQYRCDPDAIVVANELFSDTIRPRTVLFIPGARLDWVNLQEINGDLFLWPVPGYITSPYGYRKSPFTGLRQFHSGLDIGSPAGTPIRAAMSGRVSAVGWDDTFGNYVVISHHSGYRTLSGHMSMVRVKSGAYVGTGERIGDVGSTGLSTGPHLHFTVYKNGITVNPRTLIK